MWDPRDYVLVLTCLHILHPLTLCFHSRYSLCSQNVSLVHRLLQRLGRSLMMDQNRLLLCCLQDPRGWCGSSVPGSSTTCSDKPWWRTRYRLALDNFCLPDVPIVVVQANVTAIQVCIVPF